MRNIVYYVAASLDGYISGPNDDVTGFVSNGNGVEKYLADLSEFDTVIMGRKTYEFGYAYGLKPGEPAYPNMKHYIFSDHLTFEHQSESVHVKPIDANEIKALKHQSGTDIYLCGGGVFAGWLLENGLIDILKIKVSPLILGQGVPLFGTSKAVRKLRLMDSTLYDHGLQIVTYHMQEAPN